MKKTIIGTAVAGLLLTLGGASMLAPKVASGTGSFRFELHDDDGAADDGEHAVGTFVLDVDAVGKNVSGSFQFAAEHEHGRSMYPDIVVRVLKINDAEFRSRTVEFVAEGFYHDEPAIVQVSAYDGDGTLKADTLSITVFEEDGHIILEAEGELARGDIIVGEDS